MNKKLIALAVAGACVAPAAMAQTANPVTLYGRVHVNYESVEATGVVPLSRRSRIQDEASRFGIKGTEDLGGGLSAFFQLETAFYVDQNIATGQGLGAGNTPASTSPFATRNSAIGLQGGWGSLLIGRWDTPLKVAMNNLDPWGDVTWGGQAIAMFGSGANGVLAPFDRREPNAVQYWTPNWGGFSARLSYMANEGRTATLNPRSNGASVGYTRGPISVTYAYHELKDMSVASPAAVNVAAANAGNKQALNALMGGFTFGPLKIQGIYNKIKRSGFTTANFTDQKSWLVNGIWTMGNNQIILQHANNKNGGLSTLATQPECKTDSLAWMYNFSKRTSAYVQYAKIDNNDAGTCSSGTYPGTLSTTSGVVNTPTATVSLPAGQDIKALSIGMAINF